MTAAVRNDHEPQHQKYNFWSNRVASSRRKVDSKIESKVSQSQFMQNGETHK